MNNAPHLYFARQQLVEKSQLMLRPATEEPMGRTHRQRNGVCECGAGDRTPD